MNLKKIAILQLCYADYESLEISLAAYTKLTNPNIHIFLLQNGRGTYDTERTFRVCQRYAKLYSERITVVDWIAPDKPYYSIKTLLNSQEMKKYDYICKVDDDVFPLTDNWIEKLIDCYEKSYKKYGKSLGYVTSLVNNNPWGFKETVDIMELKKEFEQISVSHFTGDKNDKKGSLPYRYCKKGNIITSGGGSVWAVPFYARWIHNHTTLNAEEFVAKTSNLKYKEVDNQERYSINCMLFKREFWNDIDIGDCDDEYQTYAYCKKYNKKIVADMSVPMVHICFYTQREESRDLLPVIRSYYQKYLKLFYPISLCPLKEYENENRLRWMENIIINKYSNELLGGKSAMRHTFIEKIFSVKNSINKRHKVITFLGIHFKIKRN